MSEQNTASCLGSDQTASVFCFTQTPITFGSMPAGFVSTASRVRILQNETSFQPTSENTCFHCAFCINCASAGKGVNVLTSRPDVRVQACIWNRIFHCLKLIEGLSLPFQSWSMFPLQVQHRVGAKEMGGGHASWRTCFSLSHGFPHLQPPLHLTSSWQMFGSQSLLTEVLLSPGCHTWPEWSLGPTWLKEGTNSPGLPTPHPHNPSDQSSSCLTCSVPLYFFPSSAAESHLSFNQY